MSAVRRTSWASSDGETLGANPLIETLRSMPVLCMPTWKCHKYCPQELFPKKKGQPSYLPLTPVLRKTSGQPGMIKARDPAFAVARTGTHGSRALRRSLVNIECADPRSTPLSAAISVSSPAPESRVNCVVSLPADEVPARMRTLDPLDLLSTPAPRADNEEEDQEDIIPTTLAACNYVQTAEPPELDDGQPTSPGPVVELARALEPSNIKALPGLRGELPPEAIEEVDIYPLSSKEAYLYGCTP